MTWTTRPAHIPSTRAPGRWRFATDACSRQGARGFVADEARTEPVDGTVPELPVIGPSPAFAIAFLSTILARGTPTSMRVASRRPLVLDDDTVVQPGVMIIRGNAMAPTHRVSAADVLLVVEVVDPTEHHDRGPMLPRYARTLVPEVWLVLVAHGRIDVHREPLDGIYATVSTYEIGDALSPFAAPGIEVEVAEVFGTRVAMDG